MKTFWIIAELILVWVITTLALSAYMAVSSSGHMVKQEGLFITLFGWIFMTLFCSLFVFFFSFPAFLVFFISGMIILRMQINPWIKKSILAAINLFGIFISFYLIYSGLAHYNKEGFSIASTLRNNRIEGPLVTLALSSLLAIFLMPFPDTRSNTKNVTHFNTSN